MRCRHCNVALVQSRGLIDGEFCCPEHREAFEQERELEGSEGRPVFEPILAAIERLRRRFDWLGRTQELGLATEPLIGDPEIPESEAALNDMAAEFEMLPGAALESESVETVETVETEKTEETEPEEVYARPHAPQEMAGSWDWLRAAWRSAPRDLRLVGLLLPVLLVVAVSGSMPTVPIQKLAPQSLSTVEGEVHKRVANLDQSISSRAGVAFSDDFRMGLDAWESRSNLTRTWSYDAAGFVRPGPLAVFKPTVDLTDYRFEFLGEIDQKALGWAFRAKDLNNYYAMKFVVVKPGPLPLIHVEHYAVIGGKEGPHVDTPLPLTARADMLYRIQVNVRGSDFTVMAQGQIVDFWSDSRLERGGVGFFSNRGERARLRWVEVSHQYDTLGRLCAYLAPYGMEGRNGDIN
jgi:hypothetical protein